MPDTPIGVVYNTSMARPDAALALAAMYTMESKKESHMGSVCVVGSGFEAALFCDIIAKMYTVGVRNGNQALAVGLAAEPGMQDSPMVKAAVERKTEKGEPLYARTLTRVADTSAPAAVLRNGVIFNTDSVVILSGPSTYLAKSLDLLGTKDLYKQRVKHLVIVDAGTPYKDAAALRKVIAEWPTPVFFCPKEVGDQLRFPGAALEKDFSWAPAHPVVDAYKAYQPMPYDAPLHDLAATHYAVHPDSGFFALSAPGSITVSDDGGMKFTAGSGNVKSIGIVQAKKTELLTTLINAATEKPTAPVPGRGGARAGSGRGAFGFSGGRGGAAGASGTGRGVITPAITTPDVSK
jgi:hypothetical protein